MVTWDVQEEGKRDGEEGRGHGDVERKGGREERIILNDDKCPDPV